MSIYEQVGGEDRTAGGWRAIGSAWLMVLLLVALLAGFSAFAAHHEGWFRSPPGFDQVVVPRHDPACDALVTASAEPCPGAASFAVDGATALAPI
jgi:hypothetical protein